MMKWTTIVIGVLIVTGVSASAQRNADSFASALAEAKRLTDTEAGKKYDEEFAKSASSRVSEVVSECTHHAPQAVFDVIFIFEASGNVKQVLTSPNEPAAVCVGDKLRDLRLPPPPRADWPVVLSINIKPENASTVGALDAKFAADSLKYSRDFYSKVHFVAIADISFSPGGKMQFKYDRYPNGGPERIQVGGGEFARKNGKTWLQSNDWGETGKPVDAQATKRLNDWIALIDGRLNGEPVANEPGEGATVMKFLRKDEDGDREEFVFAESKEKPKSNSYPEVSFGRFKNSPNDSVLLSHFSGTMPLGQRNATVKLSFSYLVAVQMDPVSSASTSANAVSLLDDKLKIDIPADFVRDPDDPKEPKTIAKFSHRGEGGAWGAILRGTHGLTPEQLDGYLKMRVAEYSKGFNWLPKDAPLHWVKKEIVTIDGRKWADWRYVPMKKGARDYQDSPIYTRFLTTSYKGQLLEINFTSNLNTDLELKKEIDHIMDSVRLEE